MADNIYAAPVTIYSATPGAGLWLIDCQSTVNTAASTITIAVTVAARTVGGDGVGYYKAAGITAVAYPVQVLAAAGEAVVITIKSSNSSDTAVTLNSPTAVLQAMNTTTIKGVDADTAIAAGVDASDAASEVSSILADTGTTGVALADDAITSAKFDESTAYPLKSADSGSTQVARVGADGDTLEDLSDEIAAVKGDTAAILTDTNELQTDLTDDGRLDTILDEIAASASADIVSEQITIITED